MDFAYVAYGEENKKLISGKVSATSEEAATELWAMAAIGCSALSQFVPCLIEKNCEPAFLG